MSASTRAYVEHGRDGEPSCGSYRSREKSITDSWRHASGYAGLTFRAIRLGPGGSVGTFGREWVSLAVAGLQRRSVLRDPSQRNVCVRFQFRKFFVVESAPLKGADPLIGRASTILYEIEKLQPGSGVSVQPA